MGDEMMDVSTSEPKRPRLGESSTSRREKLAAIKVEDVIRYPLPGCSHPTDFAFSPDGKVLCALHSSEGTLQRALHVCQYPAPGAECAAQQKGDNLPGEASFQVMLEAPSGSGVDEQNLTLEEKLRRERLRERGLGITRYFWSKCDADRTAQGSSGGNDSTAGTPLVMIPLPDGVYVQRVTIKGSGAARGSWTLQGPLRKIINATSAMPVLEPTLSPDGEKISFVQGGDLHCHWLKTGESALLYPPARKAGETFECGLAEYVAQEEMDRRTGHWWSPDSKRIAFTQVHEDHIPVYRIKHLGKDEAGEGTEEEHRYPFTGGRNAVVKLLVHDLEEGTTEGTGIAVGGNSQPGKDFDAEYLARVAWFPDGRLSVQVQDRRQQRLRLYECHVSGQGATPAGGASTARNRILLEEKSDVWQNLNNGFKPLRTAGARSGGGSVGGGGGSHPTLAKIPGGFVWASERDGFRHLYLHRRDGSCVGQLTKGPYVVDALEGVDEASGNVYFTATAESELERHLYCVSLLPLLGGGRDVSTADMPGLPKPRRITTQPGIHNVLIDPHFEAFVDIHDHLDAPPEIFLRSLSDGTAQCVLHKGAISEYDERLDEMAASPPELVTIQAKDGTTLHGAVYKPDPEVYGEGPYKTLVSVYGGPHVQMVSKAWIMTVDMRAQLFRAKGYLIFKLDNRGSARRGLAFEGRIKHRMGSVEVDDQVCGVNWLVAKGLADPARVGIYGWSYGGYMSAMALAKAPDVFKAAVSGAPVTSWDGYDTHYTERYMGLMDENSKGYHESSVMSNVHTIKGKLFLIHGMIDENVHFRHTVRLINALNNASVRYDLLIFPGERHMPRGLQDRIYMEKRILRFFGEALV